LSQEARNIPGSIIPSDSQSSRIIKRPCLIDKTIRKPVDGLAQAATVANRVAEIIIDEPDDEIIWPSKEGQNNTINQEEGKWPLWELTRSCLTPRLDPWTIW
jgi:hypothetical protein